VKVVVIEDQTLFQEFVVRLLEDLPEYEVVATGRTGADALDLVRKHRPQLLILDILIPEISGIQVAAKLARECPRMRILAISSETDSKTLYQVQKLGVAGFIDKNEATVKVFREALAAMATGKRYFSESHKQALRELRSDPLAFQKILTRREQEVLTLIGGGLSDAEIGQHLGLSEGSILSHRRNLFRKLDVHSTPELIRFAQDSGFWKAAFPKMGLTDTYHIHD
jgi:two-component system nitrate/nitrite response regulator NarL